MKRIAQKGKKVDLRGKRCYIGVDVHKLTYYAALLSEDGLRVEFSSPANPDGLLDKIQGMGVEIICLAHESGPTGYELAWRCQERGIPVIVAATTKIPRKITVGGKTDRLDGIKLAEYLARGMLQGIAIPTREEFGLRELERGRQQLVSSRREPRQRIKSFLLKNGISAPDGLSHWSNAALEELGNMPLEVHLKMVLESYLRQLRFVCEEAEVVKKSISEELVKQEHVETVRYLRTIPGVGETVANTFVSEIFRPERFQREEEICAYVGLAPITSQSGQSKAKASLRHAGQRYLRSILVESAWALVRKEAHYRRIYVKLVNRTNLPQKAIVAVARKLLVIMWRVAVEKRGYRSQGA